MEGDLLYDTVINLEFVRIKVADKLLVSGYEEESLLYGLYNIMIRAIIYIYTSPCTIYIQVRTQYIYKSVHSFTFSIFNYLPLMCILLNC